MDVALTVKPNQRRNALERTPAGLIVRLTAPPVDGKANAALIKFLAKLLGIAKSKIVIKRGVTSRKKVVEIDADRSWVDARLITKDSEERSG